MTVSAVERLESLLAEKVEEVLRTRDRWTAPGLADEFMREHSTEVEEMVRDLAPNRPQAEAHKVVREFLTSAFRSICDRLCGKDDPEATIAAIENLLALAEARGCPPDEPVIPYLTRTTH